MKNAKIGAVVGFLLSFGYSLIVLLWQIVKGANFSSVAIEIFFFMLLISTISAVIGGITSAVFGYILGFYNNITIFITICVFISLFVVTPFNLTYLNWGSNIKYWDGHTLDAKNNLFWVIVPPSIIYVFASGFVSQYLYKTHKLNETNSSS